MTVPYERTNAVNRTREFLYSLLDPKQTPKVPKYIRQQARALLRHYPSELEMSIAADNEDEKQPAFRVFGKGF